LGRHSLLSLSGSHSSGTVDTWSTIVHSHFSEERDEDHRETPPETTESNEDGTGKGRKDRGGKMGQGP